MFGRVVHPLYFHHSKIGWRVFGLFGHLIAIYLRMGIYVWLVRYRGIRNYSVVRRRLRMAPSCVAIGQVASQ